MRGLSSEFSGFKSVLNGILSLLDQSFRMDTGLAYKFWYYGTKRVKRGIWKGLNIICNNLAYSFFSLTTMDGYGYMMPRISPLCG